jgi:hypothetical protein
MQYIQQHAFTVSPFLQFGVLTCPSRRACNASRVHRYIIKTSIAMLHAFKSKLALSGIVITAVLAGCVAAAPPPRAHHPAYLHALSDLRTARWLIDHRPGNWAQTADEVEAVRQIDAAIGDLKQAAYSDGKNLSDHPPVDERSDHAGRIHEALQYLRKARADISSEEDNGNAQGWRNRAIGHIDAAISAARRVFND